MQLKSSSYQNNFKQSSSLLMRGESDSARRPISVTTENLRASSFCRKGRLREGATLGVWGKFDWRRWCCGILPRAREDELANVNKSRGINVMQPIPYHLLHSVSSYTPAVLFIPR
ncbi:hypothetical protein G7K_2859-t1 [Saitoella complicata NRRL Y-17804]|uniref:Uncharacterized protein n=1 Tax=Saitoella complicata (strain BCRC 22490 / CBS 7301 / JCM 7358 / NBRC 10748 / NRRL Y-17804) TaxID=698492 RepID=A0A0E9NFS5_SAICN|nr:hypothetical protein G7K_2859-t1 [Saitoella complicata NRRL Y-17804]